MAQFGPIPKSRELREVEGERAHRPLPEPRLSESYGFPDPPKGMSAVAKRVWLEVKEYLQQIGVEKIHKITLALYCEDVADLRALQDCKRKQAKSKRMTPAQFAVTEDGRALERSIRLAKSAVRSRESHLALTPLAALRFEGSYVPMIPPTAAAGSGPVSIEDRLYA